MIYLYFPEKLKKFFFLKKEKMRLRKAIKIIKKTLGIHKYL